jgi:phosphoserine aminotransferase
LDQASKFQTPSTPNVLNIYLLAKIAGDLMTRGIQQIRNDGIYKATILYNLLEEHPLLKPFVKKKELRSETVIVIDAGEHSQRLIDYLAEKKFIVGGGYGKMKGKHVRIANFPTHSKEQFELLVDLIEKFA